MAEIHAFPPAVATGREEHLIQLILDQIAAGFDVGSRRVQIGALVREIDRMSSLADERIAAITLPPSHPDERATREVQIKLRRSLDNLRAIAATLRRTLDHSDGVRYGNAGSDR
ncbi:hypothetical protein ACIQW5_18560 [Methylorubrum thiocyanatum]|uniref:hypothetical protein n=1 Tax=Methylorubrum thiocyanatum TaxID=47958 RepID=UPI00383AADE2